MYLYLTLIFLLPPSAIMLFSIRRKYVFTPWEYGSMEVTVTHMFWTGSTGSAVDLKLGIYFLCTDLN